MAKIMSGTGILLVAALGAPLPAAAQSPDGVMLTPGVYTTPEISARCQRYAAQRVGGGGHGDRSRQAVAIACAQKLSRQAAPDAAAAAVVEAPPTAPLITAPVGLGTAPYDPLNAPYFYECRTDEGYGRIGSCDTGTY